MTRRRRPPPARCPRVGCPAKRSHDTYSSYRSGCRSDAAIADNLRYTKLLNAGIRPHHRLPIGPTSRRMQALFAVGWTGPLLAERSGIAVSHLRSIARSARPWITQDVARRIDRMFSELWDQPGPSQRGRTAAARKGWAPAAAYDDIDDMAERPKLGRVNEKRRERRQLQPDIVRLDAAGHTNQQIAWALGVTPRTVERNLARAARAAAQQQEAEAA